MRLPGAIPFAMLNQGGFKAFSSTRQGGSSQEPYSSLNLGLHVGDSSSAVIKNREEIFTARGVNPGSAVCLEQVHGSQLALVGANEAGAGWDDYGTSLKSLDGAYTNAPGLALAIGHADCMACLMVDYKKRAFGAAHAGWRGALQGILPKLVQAMRAQFNCLPEDLWAGLSPNLHPCCLRLGAEQYQDFCEQWPDSSVYAQKVSDTGFNLSLNRLAIWQLEKEGLLTRQIEVQAFCTGCNPWLFYSHRRDGGKTGRHWTVGSF